MSRMYFGSTPNNRKPESKFENFIILDDYPEWEDYTYKLEKVDIFQLHFGRKPVTGAPLKPLDAMKRHLEQKGWKKWTY